LPFNTSIPSNGDKMALDHVIEGAMSQEWVPYPTGKDMKGYILPLFLLFV